MTSPDYLQPELAAELHALLDSLLTEERLTHHDEHEIFDIDLYRELGRHGFVGLEAVPGGQRARHASQVTVLEVLGQRATSMAVSFVVQYMGVDLLHSHGTPAQQETYLAPLLKGEAICSFACSEPEGGTDVARAMTTHAEQQADGSWVLNGHKRWIGAGSTSDFLLVLARTTPLGRSSVDGITLFIVPRSAAGIDAHPIDTMGIRALEQADIRFTDVQLPPEAVLGHVDRGFRHVLGTLNGERLNAAAVATGIAHGALDYAVGYAQRRQAFGRAIGAFQALQHSLVDAAVATESARALLHRAAQTSDEEAGANEMASALAKLAASTAATTATDAGMRVMAGWGFLRQLPMQRYFRDARLYTFAPLTDEMIRNYLGEGYLGLPRSY